MSAYLDRNYAAEAIISKIKSDSDLLYSKGIPIMAQSGRYSSDLKNGILTVQDIAAGIGAQILALSSLLVLPTFAWDEDANVTSVSINSNYDVQIVFSEEELLTNYDKNWLKITGNNGGTPDEFITYASSIVPIATTLSARIEVIDKPPATLNSWTNLKIYYNH